MQLVAGQHHGSDSRSPGAADGVCNAPPRRIDHSYQAQECVSTFERFVRSMFRIIREVFDSQSEHAKRTLCHLLVRGCESGDRYVIQNYSVSGSIDVV
jgi:hypothetical protein